MILDYTNGGLMSPEVISQSSKGNFAKVNRFYSGGGNGFKEYREQIHIVDDLQL